MSTPPRVPPANWAPAAFWLRVGEAEAIKASRRRVRSRIAAALVLILIAFATVALGHASTKAIANLAHMQAQQNMHGAVD